MSCRSVSHPLLSFDEKALTVPAGYDISMDEVHALYNLCSLLQAFRWWGKACRIEEQHKYLRAAKRWRDWEEGRGGICYFLCLSPLSEHLKQTTIYGTPIVLTVALFLNVFYKQLWVIGQV